MENVLAHGLQHRPRPLEGIAVAAHHKGQRARFRSAHAAGHGGIEHDQAPGRGGLRQTPGCLRRNGGAIEKQGPRGKLIQQAPLIRAREVNGFHVGSRGQHGQHHVRALRRRQSALGAPGPRRLRGNQRGLAQIKDRHLVALGQEVPGHGATHIAKANKANACHGFCSLCRQISKGVGKPGALKVGEHHLPRQSVVARHGPGR